MKVQTVVGGGIIAAAIVAGVFLGKFKFGTGDGWGLGKGSGSGVSEAPNLDGITASTSSPVTPRPAASPEDADVLQIRIDGHTFEILEGTVNGAPQYKPVALVALVEAAKKHPGDDRGVRVRVARLSSAKAAAEIQLRDELVKEGFTPESIEWRDGPAP